MKNKFALIAAFSAMFVLIKASDEVIECCRYALGICAELILPSLFPFFIISILLNKLGLPYYLGKLLSPLAERLFKVSGAGASAFFIGITGGYPLGASYIASMNESGGISTAEAERLLAFCNNSGPAFIIGAIGTGVFHSAKAGVFLYLVHIASALITGLMLCRGKSEKVTMQKPQILNFSKALPEAVRQAVSAALNVCGFVICFTVFTGLLDTNGFFTVLSGSLSELFHTELHWSKAFLAGIFELGSAAAAMQGLIPKPINLSLAAAILSWGGISVHFQTLALISDTNIKGTLHFAGRLVSAVISAFLAYLGAYFL